MSGDGKTYLSKAKHKEFLSLLENLKTTRRKEVAEKLEEAKSLGDLSENAEYHAAREEQANIEQRILELEAMLKEAKVVEKHHSDKVEVGSVVVVKKEGSSDKKTYQLVGSEEADMSQGKISNESPLGEALMGGKKGDTVSFKSPNGETKYTIVDIE